MPLVLKSAYINIDYIFEQSSIKIYEDFNRRIILTKMYEVIKVSQDLSSIKLIE